MMTRKELMRWVNQIAQQRAREAFEQEKRSLIAELRQVAAAQGDVEQHLREAQRAAFAVMLRRRIGDSAPVRAPRACVRDRLREPDET